ncbi:MAG: O-antigen ligase family protein [Chitinophagaceae bacterium]
MEKNFLQRLSDSTMGRMRDLVFDKKMASPAGIAIMLIITLMMTYITVLKSMALGVGVVLIFAGIFFCVLCIIYPSLGFYSAYSVCLFLMLPGWFLKSAAMIPTGLIPEYISYLALLGIVSQQQYRKEITREFWQAGITTWLLILFGYTLLQFFNPSMLQKLGWFMYFRKQVSFLALFYASYCFFNSRKSIVFFTKFWIVLTTIEALYACKQQWFGFSSVEYEWLVSDPVRYNLFVNGAFVRRFGLLSDPSAAGVLYACSTVLLVSFMQSARSNAKRVFYGVLAAVHFLASSYTGTRTATLMIVAGIAFYCILTLYKKSTLIFSAVFAVAFIGLLVAPIYDNIIINRLRSTFEGSKDPSAQVRDINRHMVQPYVWSHPIGGGYATCGNVGKMYNPGHYLSNIPADSAYMQTMMEQGWVGLAFMVIFYYVIMRAGIKWVYRVRDPEIEAIYIAHLVALFSLIVGQFSQMAIGQYPNVLYYYSLMALFLKLHKYDTDKPVEYELI